MRRAHQYVCTLLVTAALLGVTVQPAQAAQTVTHDDPAFSFSLPDGFREFDISIAHPNARMRAKAEADTYYAFTNGGNPEQNNWSGVTLTVEKTDSLLLQDAAYTGPQTEATRRSWRDCTINVFTKEREYNTLGDRELQLNVAIPLAAQPLMFKLKGDTQYRDGIQDTLEMILSSFTGELSCQSKTDRMLWYVGIPAALAGALLYRRVAKRRG